MIHDRRIPLLLLGLALQIVSKASARSAAPAFITPSSRNVFIDRKLGHGLSLSNGNHDGAVEVKTIIRKCKSFSAALCTAGALLLQSNPSMDQVKLEGTNFYPPIIERIAEFTRAQPAYAADSMVPNFNDEITLDANDEREILKRRQRSTVLDEVWTLVNKYYLDNTHNGQDWDNVRDTFESRLKLGDDGSYDDDEAMKLANTMVKILGDKYSRILDKEGYARIQKYDLIGVGATLMPDGDKRIIVGAPPVKNSEADLAGMKYGDFIVAVNGVKTEGRTAFDIIDQISEDPNAQVVTMTVLTTGPDDLKGEGYMRDLTMKRQFAEVRNPIAFKISEKRSDGTVVGYIRISEFNSIVKPKLENAIKSLRKDGANAYVMDLRGNPGGAFQSAVEIAGLFMDNKIATNVVDSNQVEMPFRTTTGKALIGDQTPLVIWLDGGSASASEVLAGALHDQCRAVVMGSNSFGKGLIQAVYGLKDGSGLVLTVAKYVTPSGTDIQGSGITPDINAKLPTPLVIGLSTDTSKVDFKDVVSRTSQCTCPVAIN